MKPFPFIFNNSAGESQNVHTGLQLLGALENHGLISPQNGGMSLLTELFQLIHRNDLSRKIVSFEKGREAPPNKKLDPIEMSEFTVFSLMLSTIQASLFLVKYSF